MCWAFSPKKLKTKLVWFPFPLNQNHSLVQFPNFFHITKNWHTSACCCGSKSSGHKTSGASKRHRSWASIGPISLQETLKEKLQKDPGKCRKTCQEFLPQDFVFLGEWSCAIPLHHPVPKQVLTPSIFGVKHYPPNLLLLCHGLWWPIFFSSWFLSGRNSNWELWGFVSKSACPGCFPMFLLAVLS